MKPSVSSLNPDAAIYIPLSKREAGLNIDVPDATSRVTNAHSLQYGKTSYHSHAHVNEASTLKSPCHVQSPRTANEMRDKQMADVEFEMDMDHLKALFPGISNQSLADVYSLNMGDLEITIDMLDQLECSSVRDSENLPDTLDIGDVTESSGSSAGCSSSK